jgi:AGCS family alanine or glycine:cation symporter
MPFKITSKKLANLALFIITSIAASPALAQNHEEIVSFRETVQSFFSEINYFTESVLMYEFFGFPFLVTWLFIAGIYFTFRLGFINIRLFKHAIHSVAGRFSKDTDPGEVTHFQALTSATSATVGLGNIGGVAFAVAMGGPGAIFWMIACGFFGMTAKFAEVMLGVKYRELLPDGRVNGGAYEYLKKGLAEKGYVKFGLVLSFIFAICCVGGSIGSGNMYQINQSMSVIADTFSFAEQYRFFISMFVAILVGIVLFGGIKRIGQVAERIVPFMAIFYIISCLIVLSSNSDLIWDAVKLILTSAFDFDAAKYGFAAAIINGLIRAFFSSEAGMGSAPTAHSAAKTKEPVREGCVALLEPFIDTVVICTMTGLVIVTTGVYTDSTAEGAVLTAAPLKL